MRTWTWWLISVSIYSNLQTKKKILYKFFWQSTVRNYFKFKNKLVPSKNKKFKFSTWLNLYKSLLFGFSLVFKTSFFKLHIKSESTSRFDMVKCVKGWWLIEMPWMEIKKILILTSALPWGKFANIDHLNPQFRFCLQTLRLSFASSGL